MVLGMTLGNDLEDEEIEFTDEESMTSDENSDGSRSSKRGGDNGLLKLPGFKKNGFNTKGGLFGDGIQDQESEALRQRGETYIQNKKLADEINEQGKGDRYGLDEKLQNMDGKLGDINPQMRELFDKLRGVQGQLDRKGNLHLDEIEPSEKKTRKEGINDLMKQLNKLEKKSAIGSGDSGQRLYEERTINDFKRDITS